MTLPARSKQPFGVALRRLLEANGVSHRLLAIRTGLSYGYVGQIIRGPHHDSGRPAPSASNMRAIASALGVPPVYFLEYRQHLASEEAIKRVSELGLDEVLRRLRD